MAFSESGIKPTLAVLRSLHTRWRYIACEGAQLAIGIVWLWSASAKVVEWASFQRIVTAHGLLPSSPALVAVPVAEFAIGAFIVVAGAQCRLRSSACAASLLAIAVLTCYLLLIPRDVLASAGCGCGGIAGIHHGELPSAMIRNASIGLLHVPAFAGRWRTARVGPEAMILGTNWNGGNV